MDKSQREEERRREDRALYRILLWFGGAVVAELLLLLLDEYYISIRPANIDITIALSNAMPYLVAVFAALALGGAIWARKTKEDSKSAVIWTCSGIMAALSMGVLATLLFHESGLQIMCAVVPGVAVLALVYYLFQPEFFTVASVSCLGILGQWVAGQVAGGLYGWVYGAGLLVATAVVTAVCLKAKANGGVLSLGERKLRLFSRTANYRMIFLTCGVTLALFVAAMVLGTMAAFPLMFAQVAWVFVMAVYFTVKLM